MTDGDLNPNGNRATGVEIRVQGVPGVGDTVVRLTLMETRGGETVDLLKARVEEVMRAAGITEILRRDWGFWSAHRCITNNMPLRELCAMDLPLKFCWHTWSDSYRNRRVWLPRDLYK